MLMVREERDEKEEAEAEDPRTTSPPLAPFGAFFARMSFVPVTMWR